MEEEAKQEFLDFIKGDVKNLNLALDRLIDSVSSFKGKGTDVFTEDDPEGLWIKMQEDLDFAKFIISGLMYAHGLPLCNHDHDEEEDVD
jgi:hypothetical protein